jgi:hypothetical protein
MRQAAQRPRRGAILAVALATLLVVMLLAGVVLRSYLHAHRQLRHEQDQLQAEWLAESALARAIARHKQDAAYAGEIWQIELPRSAGQPAPGVAKIKIIPPAAPAMELKIEIEAQFPADETTGIRAHREHSFVPSPTAN